MNEKISRFPLQWPAGWKRTKPEDRARGNFAKRESSGSAYRPLRDVTLFAAIERLLAELGRMGIGADDVVISTNVRTRLDGLPRSGEAEPSDVGAAVYWLDVGKGTRCMAIDRYARVAQNVAALAATIEAMRAIERHGGAQILDRAFAGFAALPAPIAAGMHRDWQIVLELADLLLPKLEDIEGAYRRLAMKCHPDRGGSEQKMSELNVARAEALDFLKGVRNG